MAAIFLPRRWRHQPAGAVEIDTRHEIGQKVLWVYTPWLGLSSVTPGKVRGIGARVDTTQDAIDRYGRGALVDRTGAYAGAGIRFTGTDTPLAAPSSGGAVFMLMGRASFYDNASHAFMRFGSGSDFLGFAAHSVGRSPYIYVSALTRVTGSDIGIRAGFTGSIALSCVNRADTTFYGDGRADPSWIGQSLGGFSIDNIYGLGSSTQRWLEYSCPLLMRTDYLAPDEVRALDEAPWAIFRAPSHRIWFDVGAGAPAAIEGDVVAEESGADTLAATGSVVVAGSLAAAETGADTFAATGGAVATGTLAASETGVDTLAFAGKVLVAGGLAAAEAGADNAAATGAVLVAGSLAATETAHDTFSASGAGLVAGTLAAVESGADMITVAGKVVVSGALSAAEVGADTAQATGAVRVSGALSASETGTDTFSSTGEQPRITGEFAASEIGTDGFAAVGIVPAIGSFDLLEAGHDTLAGVGQIIVAGVLVAVESGVDSFYATPAGAIVGVMAAVEAADAFAARGHGRSAHGARMSTDRGYQSMTTRRPRQRG